MSPCNFLSNHNLKLELNSQRKCNSTYTCFPFRFKFWIVDIAAALINFVFFFIEGEAIVNFRDWKLRTAACIISTEVEIYEQQNSVGLLANKEKLLQAADFWLRYQISLCDLKADQNVRLKKL